MRRVFLFVYYAVRECRFVFVLGVCCCLCICLCLRSVIEVGACVFVMLIVSAVLCSAVCVWCACLSCAVEVCD